jgi:hypothetical protein
MIIVRNVFQLKFGKAKEAVSLWREGIETAKRKGHLSGEARVLTDLVGPSYTLVVEFPAESLAEYESSSLATMADPDWRAWYPKFVPLAESAYREIFQVAE